MRLTRVSTKIWVVFSLITVISCQPKPQQIPPGLFTGLAEENDPVVIGEITAVSDNASLFTRVHQGTVTLRVAKVLRGSGVGNSVELPFDWREHPLKRMNQWEYRHPKKGMRVLLILIKGDSGHWLAKSSLLDLDSPEASLLPEIQRAISVQKAEGPEGKKTLVSALNDNSFLVRSTAESSVPVKCANDSFCKMEAVTTERRRLLSPETKDRSSAMTTLQFLYDARTPNMESNKLILSTWLELASDNDESIRRQAVNQAYDSLVRGKSRPDLTRLKLDNKAKIIQRLKLDARAAQGEFSEKADALAKQLQK